MKSKTVEVYEDVYKFLNVFIIVIKVNFFYYKIIFYVVYTLENLLWSFSEYYFIL